LENIYECEGTYFQLRDDAISFLDNLLQLFNVGIWSSMVQSKLERTVYLLQKISKRDYSFFIVWGREKCYVDDHILNIDQYAVFKPIWYLWYSFPSKMSRKNTVLLDQSPCTSCMNPKSIGIFVQDFKENNSTTFLSTILWPYLHAMANANSVDGFISKNYLGKNPITNDEVLLKELRKLIFNASWRIAPPTLVKVLENIKAISKMEVISKMVHLDACQLDILRGHANIRRQSSRGHMIVLSQHLGLPNNGYSEKEMREFMTLLKR